MKEKDAKHMTIAPRPVIRNLACSLLAACIPLAGAETPDEPHDRPWGRLPDLTVAGTPIVRESIVADDGARYEYVGIEQINAMNAHDLADALRRVPGVSMSRWNRVGSFGGGAGGAVFIRGHGSGRPGSEIGTLVDGIPRVNSVWSHALLDTLSIDLAHRVEVRKSPDPVFTGNMGFATVNLVPKRADRPGWQGRLATAYGADNTWTQKLELGVRQGTLDAYLAGSHRRSDGHRDDSGGEINALYGLFGWRPNTEWDLTLLVNHTDSWADDPGPRGAGAGEHIERYSTDAQFYVLTLAHDVDAARGHVKLYYEDGRATWKQFEDDGAEYRHIPEYDNWGIHLREILTPWTGGALTIGIDWDHITGKARDVYSDGRIEHDLSRIRMRRMSPYASVAHTFGETVAVTPSIGTRWTDTRYFGADWGFHAGVTARYRNTTLFANYARAHNYPGIYTAMFYENFWRRAPGNNPEGWKDLDPERMDHWELGISQVFGNRADATLSVYRGKVRDALRIVLPPPPPPTWRNVGSYTTNGSELTMRLYPADKVDLFFGLAYMKTTPDDVPNAPDWSCSAGVEYRPNARLTLNLDAEYVGRREVVNTRRQDLPQERVGSYLLVNARAGLVVTRPRSRWRGELFVAGDNITDETYEHQPGYPMPGASLTAGIDLRF